MRLLCSALPIPAAAAARCDSRPAAVRARAQASAPKPSRGCSPGWSARQSGERCACARLVASAPIETEAEPPTLLAGWDAAVASLPPDWSDLYCELELTSSDYLQRGALLLAPINPTRIAGGSMLRFRVARRFGYGASAPMTRRCFARADAEGITGRVSILRALSDTHNVDTQGPVWYVEGKAV